MGEILGFIVLLAVAISAVWKIIYDAGFKGSPLPDKVPSDVQRWKGDAMQYAKQYGLPWHVILAQIWQESLGDPNAVGSAGEIGLMQLKQIAIDDLEIMGFGTFPGWKDDPEMNIKAGTAFTKLQLIRSGSLHSSLANVRSTALEAYNEGYAGSLKDLGPDEYADQVMEKAQMIGYNV